jgi:autotransporter-associated beta strand protein
MKKSHLFSLLTGLALAIATSSGVGETLVVSDNYNTATSGTGFALNTGVNLGINPPSVTRLGGTEGTLAVGLRYMLGAGVGKAPSAYSIGTNKLLVTSVTNSGRFSLSADGVNSYNFSSALGSGTGTPANPVVYDVRISMAQNAPGTQRMSFGFGTVEQNNDKWDFGIQLYKRTAGTSKSTDGILVDTDSSGVDDFKEEVEAGIVNVGKEVDFLIRVTDAGAESGANYHSRVRVSRNGGTTWFYDTATDTANLPNGWRFDDTPRYFIWDQASSAGPVTYDDFSITLFPEKTWNGGTDSNWNTAGNWNGSVAPSEGDSLVFNGTSGQLNDNNRLASDLKTIPSITFNNGGFSLSGNSLTLNNSINNIAGNNSINISLTLGGFIKIDSTSGTLTLDGKVSGSGKGLTKQGNGTVTLGAANTYSGATTVSAGTLLVNGSTASGSAVSVASGATLGGSGTVSGSVALSGAISPGDSTAGTLTTGALTLNGGGTYLWEVDDSGNDAINAESLNIAATSSSKFNINISALASLTGWSSTTGHQWTLVHTTGGITDFDAAAFAFTDNFTAQGNSLGVAGYFTVAQSGNDLVLNFNPLTTANDEIQRVVGKGVKVAVADLLSNDVASGASITSIDTTGMDGTATLSGGWIFYVPSENDAASDAFIYTLTDANGKTATATATITSHAAVTQTRQLTSVTAGGGSFYGVPGTSYTVQYSDTLEEGDWHTLMTVTTDENGLASFTDPGPLPDERYYRITYP